MIRYDVVFKKYNVSKKSQMSTIRFFGRGTIFIYDTALIFQGNISKVNITWLDEIYSKILWVTTTKTVPYSTIINYQEPNWMNKNLHRLTYKLPDTTNCILQFKIPKSRTINKNFSSTLRNYLSTLSNS